MYTICFVAIFEFILIYLLYVLFILKVEDNFGRRKSMSKRGKICYFLYIFARLSTLFIALTFENYERCFLLNFDFD